MPLLHALEEARLVDHEVLAERGEAVDERRRRQLHRRRLAAGAQLERAVQRAEQLPAGEPARQVVVRRPRGQVGREEGVGERARRHRLRHDLLRRELRGHERLGRRLAPTIGEVLLGELGAGLEEPVAAQLLGGRPGPGADVEQRQQARVAGRDLGEDRRDAVEPLEQLGARGARQGGVVLDAGALGAHEQGDDLELRPVGRARLALRADPGLDLAHPACEHRDERSRVVSSGLGTVAPAVSLEPSVDRRRTRAGMFLLVMQVTASCAPPAGGRAWAVVTRSVARRSTLDVPLSRSRVEAEVSTCASGVERSPMAEAAPAARGASWHRDPSTLHADDRYRRRARDATVPGAVRDRRAQRSAEADPDDDADEVGDRPWRAGPRRRCARPRAGAGLRPSRALTQPVSTRADGDADRP